MSEDDMDASRAPLIEHLIELRQRLMRAMAFLAVAFVVCYYFSEDIYGFLAQPLANAYGGEQARMIITAPQEAFFTYLKLSLFGGFCLAFPLIANQIWAFVAPGLYSHEKRAFLPFLLATPVLFLIGASLVYFLIMPLALEFFLSFQTTGQDTPLPIQLETRVSEYLSLVMTLILAFGISFQLPILLILMARVGLTSADGLKRGRKYAIVGIFGAAAILTPPDPISQIGLALPIILLYEFSVWAVTRTERKQAAARAAEEAEE
ncbi:MAG: twin-arginine translocase subunit TatC [Alphaproteobacteria bacterium]|nr:twin-arginine translocase subunit TatC [Alphaproteobacteria bacterium]MDX5369867.1 twin-arginine translocase subunit TatC [Alphaproteobacteria bacterium]MDX5464483.1 twin-arginine translocase subunit TatC [Alphaproteobacteria bacterium]